MYLFKNVSSDLNEFQSEIQNTSAKTRIIIFITCRNIKRPSKWQTYNYFMNSDEHKKDVSKKFSHKKIDGNYLGAFSLSSDIRKEKFISAFISKLDAIYCLSKAHFSLARRIHGPCRHCVPELPASPGLGC